MSKRKALACLTTAIMTLVSTSGCAAIANKSSFGDATITVCIVDDKRQPIEGVHSKLFSLSSYDAPSGLTDTNGIYSVHLKEIYSQVSGSFNKQGYYKSIGPFWHWSQWGEVPPADTNLTIVLKRIIAPVPMSYREIRTYIPIHDEVVVFDLEKGDWVVPHGKGQIADFKMVSSLRFESRQDFEVKASVEFADALCSIQSFTAPNPNDINQMRSELMPPPIAPDTGYEHTLSLWGISTPTPKQYQSHRIGDRNYIFRTRVVTNEAGEIIKANYGWTVGEIIVDPSQNNKIFLNFRYYYNPDPKSRSLEPKEIADRQAKDMPKDMPKETQE